MNTDHVLLAVARDFQLDETTADHCARVQSASIVIGEALDFPGDVLNDLSRTAYLHDIGKSEVDRGPNPDMRHHAELGYRMIATIPSMAQFALAILGHHEHWDGSGYPRGLVGGDIPLFARIIAIAETYDEIRYGDGDGQAGQGHNAALAHMQAGAGSLYDPHLVHLFAVLVRSGDFDQGK